jgi:hypothetical protein
MAYSIKEYAHEWARRLGGTLTGGENETQLFKIVAGARGAGMTGQMSRLQAIRAIAASYGKDSGTYNALSCFRSIVDVLGVTPAGRYLSDLNEREAIAAILGGVLSSGSSGSSGDFLVDGSGNYVTDESGNRIII